MVRHKVQLLASGRLMLKEFRYRWLIEHPEMEDFGQFYNLV